MGVPGCDWPSWIVFVACDMVHKLFECKGLPRQMRLYANLSHQKTPGHPALLRDTAEVNKATILPLSIDGGRDDMRWHLAHVVILAVVNDQGPSDGSIRDCASR